jgi:hypothetical protein
MPGPTFVDIALGDRTFQVRRKHAWGTYRVLLPLNEKRAEVAAGLQALRLELLKLVKPFPTDDEGNIDSDALDADGLAALEEILPKITQIQARADILSNELLDVQVAQARVMLGNDADDFFGMLDDVDMDEAVEIVRKISDGHGDDLDPEVTAEAAGIPLDGATGESPLPTPTQWPQQPGEGISSGSALTPMPSATPTPQQSSSPI